MATATPTAVPSRWELAAETIAVKIRWFGLVVGYVLVNVDDRGADHQALLNAILALGAVYALCDTYYSLRGRVFLGRYPLYATGSSSTKLTVSGAKFPFSGAKLACLPLAKLAGSRGR